MIEQFESRLSAALSERSGAITPGASIPQTAVLAEPVPTLPQEPNGNAVDVSPNAPEDTNVWPDESAESAFIAETRARGEPVVRVPATEQEENDPKALPALDQLVQRIPAEVQAVLEDLFRAKFTTVRRVKKSDLKT